MKTSLAFGAGVLGGLVMIILMGIARWLGMPMNIEATLGSLLGLDPTGTTTWLIGFVMHLIISGLIALLYALGFERVTHRAGPDLGVAFAIVHILIAGLMFALLPVIHPAMPEILTAPGAFMANFGAIGIVFFVAVHLLYGAIVGGMYAGEAVFTRQEPVGI